MTPAHLPSPLHAVVIGGGLAGITAAIALAESGAQVTLLEARPRLGGATCSFTRDGLTVDTGQHVFLGCCTAYRGLLAQLGMTDHAPLQPRFDVTVLAPGGRRARLRRTALPGPVHMLPALARYSFLSWPERAVVSRPALAMRALDPADPALDAQRFGDWLAARGQSERARRALWDLFTVSALNIAGDDASLALAATVVKTGLLGKNNAADIGVAARPLGELHGDAGAALLARLGAQVRLNAKVTAIEPMSLEAGHGDVPHATFRVRLAGPAMAEGVAAATELTADAVVLAVPHEAAARLIPRGALPLATVDGWAGLGASPIVNVHVIYDRPVTDLPFAAAVDSPVQWVFDRTAISGLSRSRTGQQYLAISLSAADEYVDVPAAQLREQFVPALADLFPAARDAKVSEFFVTRERRATFRQAPGTAALRPKPATRLPGLVLAGAWTDTGWPDTMEGAVRSGLAAAIELRRALRPTSAASTAFPRTAVTAASPHTTTVTAASPQTAGPVGASPQTTGTTGASPPKAVGTVSPPTTAATAASPLTTEVRQ
jgi:squalene-associated FAD-dependent desaturase